MNIHPEKKRNGSFLIAVALVAVGTAVVTAAVSRAVSDLSKSKSNLDASMYIYDDLSFADLAICAFVDDIGSAWASHVVELGELGLPEDPETGEIQTHEEVYTKLLEDITNAYFVEQDDGRYLYKVDNAGAILEHMVNDTAHEISPSAKVHIQKLADSIRTFSISMSSPLCYDGDNGVETFEVCLNFQHGADRYTQIYEISGIVAEREATASGFIFQLNAIDAKINLLHQEIN